MRKEIQADGIRDKGLLERQKGIRETEKEQKRQSGVADAGTCMYGMVGVEKGRERDGGPARSSVGGESGPGHVERKLRKGE